ncbi:TIGR02302 family protein [Roseicitreum antarcticum]|uniref:TIGR02302 family protein n=1 Tax=Roseicitreum antarcticum TaxID=564137 RepID=A0A1H3AM61_9RHOB|nr:TIGR02302 family protein [Roseicitreum antarcticum]SDX30820.1 TIGR02302 family protein [Roseicitreum antarcticum]
MMRHTPEPIRNALRRTWAGMLAEQFFRTFWPVWTLVLLFAAALGLGVQDAVSPGIATVLALGFAVALLVALFMGVYRFDWPTRGDALRRLDASMPGRPLSALADSQAVGTADPASAQVWQAHLRRMAAQLARARAVVPDLKLARFDPFALRYAALTGVVLAVLFGAPGRVAELPQIAQLSGRAEAVALGPSWEAWVQPPPYTGRPSLYLNEIDRAALEIPQGSLVTTRFYGQAGVMTLSEGVSGREGADPADTAQEFEVLQSGRLSIRGPAGREWEVTVLPDQPPSVALAGAMQRERGGTMRQDFTANDDYGVTDGVARIALDLDRVDRRYGLSLPPEGRAAVEIPLPLPVSGSRADVTESLIDDFSQHPWANLPVTLHMTAMDARDQTGTSGAVQVVLPGRRFFEPMAAAVIEMRRDLLWNVENAPRVVQVMRAVSHRPDEVFRSDDLAPRFRAVQDVLEASLTTSPDAQLEPEARDQIAELLWDLAVVLEDGELADAAERLRRAQERLDEAVRNGADPSEITELMDELREALRDYMQQLAEQPQERGDPQPSDGEQMEITQDQIQELLDRIQELMQEGRMDEAAQLLAQLQALLENLQVAEGQGQGQGGQGQPGAGAMQDLGDALRDQQDLADDTFRELQEEFNRGDPQEDGQSGEGEDGEGQDGDSPDGQGQGGGQDRTGQGGTAGDLAERQQALREMLREQQLQPLPGEGTAEGEAALQSLERAERAMRDAEEALRNGDTSGALDRQSEALEAMRQGLRDMDSAMAQDRRDAADAGEGRAEGGRSEGRDPLGRDSTASGEVGTDQDMLQSDDIQRRARDILDEIRRRSAELGRPEAELDYLRRLLDRF